MNMQAIAMERAGKAMTMAEGQREMPAAEGDRYARAVAISKRVRWDIDTDVIRNRSFDMADKFLPDGLSQIQEFHFLSAEEKRFLSRIQGRTYANIFGLVERFISAKVLELAHDHWMGDQIALEALVRFSDEELKHQELFRRIERLAADAMPKGYAFAPHSNDVAAAVLSSSTWAVLALTLHIELFTQLHYRESIESDDGLSPLFKDVFLFHWKEEAQHAVIDELEWRRHDATMSQAERDKAVDEFIALVGAVDGILRLQAANDAGYFASACGRVLSTAQHEAVEQGILKAYRWQYIISGAQHPPFVKILTELTSEAQRARILAALSTLM